MNLVIFVGNPHRGDDGIGHHLYLSLQHHLPESWEGLYIKEPGPDLYEYWKNNHRVVLIDAMLDPDSPLGRFCPMEIKDDTPLQDIPFPASTHGYSIHAAIETARNLNQLPPDFWIIGIAAHQMELGGELSLKLRKSLPQIADQVLRFMQRDSID